MITVGELVDSLAGIDRSVPIRAVLSYHDHYAIEGVYYYGEGDVEFDLTSIENNGE